jgi:bile acid:Na+ symporter, BASS family
MTPQVIVGLALKTSIMLTVFGFGLQAKVEDLLYLLRRPRLLMLSLTAMFVVMPICAVLLTKVGSFNPAVVIALIVLSISPLPPLLPRKMTKSGGIAPYGLGLMAIAATLSIAYIPLAAYLLGKYFNRPFSMDPVDVAELVGSTVLIPLAVGLIFRKLAPALAERLANPISRIAGIVLLIGALCILVFALPSIWALIGNGTVLAFIAFVVLGMLVGHLFAAPDPDRQVTLALATACRHPALALAIATANIPEETGVVSAILLYLLINAIATIPYIAWQRNRAKKLATSS